MCAITHTRNSNPHFRGYRTILECLWDKWGFLKYGNDRTHTLSIENLEAVQTKFDQMGLMEDDMMYNYIVDFLTYSPQ